MPDIAMCQNKSCPSSNRCHRFLVIPSEFSQVYVQFTPTDGEEQCIYFIDYDQTRTNTGTIPRQ